MVFLLIFFKCKSRRQRRRHLVHIVNADDDGSLSFVDEHEMDDIRAIVSDTKQDKNDKADAEWVCCGVCVCVYGWVGLGVGGCTLIRFYYTYIHVFKH